MKTDICTSSFLWISSFYFLQIVIHFLIIEEHYLMPKNRIAFEKNVVTTSPVQIIAVNPVTAWVFICRFSYLIWNIYFTLFQFQKPAFLATKKTLSSKIILLIMKFHPFTRTTESSLKITTCSRGKLNHDITPSHANVKPTTFCCLCL